MKKLFWLGIKVAVVAVQILSQERLTLFYKFADLPCSTKYISHDFQCGHSTKGNMWCQNWWINQQVLRNCDFFVSSQVLLQKISHDTLGWFQWKEMHWLWPWMKYSKNLKPLLPSALSIKAYWAFKKTHKATLKKNNGGSITINSEENIMNFINNNRVCLMSDNLLHKIVQGSLGFCVIIATD